MTGLRVSELIGLRRNDIHPDSITMAGAAVKDAQAQLRHSRASMTLDIYQQFVSESKRRAVDRLTTLGSQRVN